MIHFYLSLACRLLQGDFLRLAATCSICEEQVTLVMVESAKTSSQLAIAQMLLFSIDCFGLLRCVGFRFLLDHRRYTCATAAPWGCYCLHSRSLFVKRPRPHSSLSEDPPGLAASPEATSSLACLSQSGCLSCD